MSEQITPAKSKQTPGNLFMVFVLCLGGIIPAIMFLFKWMCSDIETTLEHFCTFVEGVFND